MTPSAHVRLDRARVRAGAVSDLLLIAADPRTGPRRAHRFLITVGQVPGGGFEWQPRLRFAVPLRSVRVRRTGSGMRMVVRVGRRTDIATVLRAVHELVRPRALAAAGWHDDVAAARDVRLAWLGRYEGVRWLDPQAEPTDRIRPMDVLVAPAGEPSPPRETYGDRLDADAGALVAAGRALAVVDPWAHGPRGRPTEAREPRPATLVWQPGEAGGVPTWRVVDGPPLMTGWTSAEQLDEAQARSLHRVSVLQWDAGVPDDPWAAALLARLAATGVPLHSPDLPPRVAQRLGPLTRAALAEPVDPEADPLDRTARSVRQRRAALVEHTFARAVPGLLAGAAPGSAEWAPALSAVLVTQRPDRLPSALAMLARTTYPRLELVVAAHGFAVEPRLRATLDALPFPVVATEYPRDMRFGEVLGRATDAASGALVTKVDDDDVYGPWHFWDLVVAREYSGATVVGKTTQFIYLEQLDTTVLTRWSHHERYTSAVAGGTMLMARSDLAAVGGWRPVPRSVDRGLLDRVAADGGRVYGTHGFGFVYVRHSEGHTWGRHLGRFLRGAAGQWHGLPGFDELLGEGG